MDQITIGYLSWKRHTVLKQTLQSHKDNGLYDLIKPENRIIFFQEITEVDKQIASEYDIQYLGDNKNIGILNAFVELVKKCKTKYFIFCENDFLLMQDGYDIYKTLSDAISIMETNKLAQVKLSNSKNPGFLYIKGNNDWLKHDQSGFPYKAESLSWVPNPKDFYQHIKTLNFNYEWFEFSSQDQRWSNHIYACNMSYMQEVIVPLLLHSRDNNRQLELRYQGLEDTLNFTDQIPCVSEHMRKQIEEHKKRKVYSGGGNFYHNA